MKKILPLLLMMVLCVSLASCGSGTISGDPVKYSNADKSFSIELPTANEEAWIINEEAPGSVLDITDKKDTVNIQVQCISKSEAQHVANDLVSYKDYSMVNTLADILSQTELKDTDVETADFITDKMAYEFSLEDNVKGTVVFMESEKCYYTFFIMAVDKAYSANSKVFAESIASLQELTDTSQGSDSQNDQDSQDNQ